MRAFGPGDILYIIEAARWTLALSAIAFVGGGIVGLGVALARSSDVKALRYLFIGYITVFQGTPLLMQLFIAYYGPSILGLDMNPWSAAALALILNTGAFLGEIWRGSIEAVPRGQWEAAISLGLRYPTMMRHVILPPALKIALAPTIGFLVQLIKATSLASIIGFVEMTRAAQVVNNATFHPFTIFGIVALTYFLLCWPLSTYSRRVEAKLAAAARRG